MCNENFTQSQLDISVRIGATSAGLSIFGSFATIIFIILAYSKEKFVPTPRQSRRRANSLLSIQRNAVTQLGSMKQFIFWLAFVNLCGASFMFISDMILAVAPVLYTVEICRWMRYGVQMFLGSSFFWTTFIAIAMYQETKSDHPFVYIPRGIIAVCHVLAWGYPLATVIGMIAYPDVITNTLEGWCSLQTQYNWTWFSVIVVSVILNMVFYVLILQKLSGTWSFFSDKKSLLWLKFKFSSYLLTFIFCWIWDVIYNVYSLLGACEPLWVIIMKQVFPPLQGFLNFLIFVSLYRNPKSAPSEMESKERFDFMDDETSNLLSGKLLQYYEQEN